MKTSIRSILASALLAGLASAQSTVRVSVDSAGVQGNDTSANASISGDGRYVTFESAASNLVAGDTNATRDIFVRDLHSGQTTRVSVDSTGAQSNGYSSLPRISGDGRYVTFMSFASNLVPADTNGFSDVFVHDLQSGQTTLVSIDWTGAHPGNGSSFDPWISTDGRYVVFVSHASNLVTSVNTFGIENVFLHDRLTGLTTVESVSSAGAPAQGPCSKGSISTDGRYVAFSSQAPNLVIGDSNSFDDAFVHDRVTGQTARSSVSSTGVQCNGSSGSDTNALTADGRYVVFASGGANLIDGYTALATEVYLHDMQTGQTSMASVDSAGMEGNGGAAYNAISSDGRCVAFSGYASNLVPGDTNGPGFDVFVHDLLTGQTTRVSVDSAGAQASNLSTNRLDAISADGRYVAFSSDATNLVSGDTNGYSDVFVRDRQGSMSTIYCTAKTNSQGCTPAIDSNGSPSASAGSGFDITATGEINNKNGLLFYSTVGQQALPFQDGLLCVKAPIKRTAVQNAAGNPPPNDCSGHYSLDFNVHIASGLDPALVFDQQVWAQYWARDPASGSTTNLSNAIEFTIGS